MAALNIKNIPTGPGDDIKIDASYAKGTTKNVIATSGTSPSFAMFGGSGFGYQSVGFGATTDAVYVSGGDLVLTNAWGVRGAFNHNWNPYWSTSLFGSYSAVRYDDSGQGRILYSLQRQPPRCDRCRGSLGPTAVIPTSTSRSSAS